MGKRVPLDPKAPLVPEVKAFLATYQPRMIDNEWWATHRDFICGTVEAARPLGVPAARMLCTSLVRLVAYTEHIGQPIERRVVLDPDNIEAYVALARSPRAARMGMTLLKDPMLKRVRSDVERLGRALLPRAAWEPDREVIPRTKVRPPHTPTEERNFLHQARRSRSIHHLAVAVLGSGCGLDGRWQPDAFHDRVELRDGIYWVRVDNPDREVPLLARYRDDLARVLDEAPEGVPLIGGKPGSRHRTSQVTEKLSTRTGVRLEPARMRASWFVRHIDHGTDLRLLTAMGGITSMTTIWELAGFAKPIDMVVNARKAVRA